MSKNKYDKILGEYRENDGIRSANSTTYFSFDGNTVYLYVNGSVAQKWTVTATTTSTVTIGTPYGLLLVLTQPE